MTIGEGGGGIDQHIEALPGHEAAEPQQHRRRRIEPETLPRRRPRVIIERREPVDIDARRDHDGRQWSAGGMDRLGRRIATSGDDDPGTAQHPAEHPTRTGESARHGDLGTMDDHAVRPFESRPQPAERQCRIEQHEVGTDLVGETIDAPHQRVGRQQPAGAVALDPDGLAAIELCGSRMRGGEDRGRLGRQSPPQLPEVRLDATELGREVVGDEQVLHATASARRRSTRSSAQRACSASRSSSLPAKVRSSSSDRRSSTGVTLPSATSALRRR